MKKILILLTITMIAFSCSDDFSSGTTSSNIQEGDTSGVNGSYTALVAVGNFLYYIQNSKLITANVSNPTVVQIVDEQEVGAEVESIFYRKELLFIGSGPALHIYTIGNDGIPQRLSETSYSNFDEDFIPCDPVVADDQYAYVTLSSIEVATNELGCTRLVPINELRIYDIQDLENPVNVSTFEMVKPKGLSIDGDILFVCDSHAGLKVLNVSDRTNPIEIAGLTDAETYDVIARNGLAIVTGPKAILEYDYTDLENIRLISSFNID